MKYTTKYFYHSMPEWKRIKDPILTRLFYRPVSFFLASVCANLGISANTVSFSSAFVAIVACAMFVPNNYYLHIVGGILCNVWLIMDCIDGNLARGVKKQAFGPFADSMSSYILVGLLGAPMGYAVYNDGGFIVGKSYAWIILLGAIATLADTMMRLIYQKYKNVERELADKGVLEVAYDQRLDNSQTNSWRVRIESDWGIGGVLPIFILLGTIFHALDLVIFYCLLYYGGSFLAITLSLVKRAIAAQRKYTIDN